MAGVLFIPSIAAVLNNPRVSDHISLSQLTFDWPNYLQMLRALFFPAENMFNFSAVVHDNWYSIAAYLPLVGVCLVLAYLLRWKWDWLHVLLVGLFLVAASPVSNSLFVMFTSEPYRRWYYMLVFLLVLAPSRCWTICRTTLGVRAAVFRLQSSPLSRCICTSSAIP